MADDAVIMVPITKGGATIAMNVQELPMEVYRELLIQGAKAVLNRGMSKITVKDLEGEELAKAQAAAMAKAQENLEACKEGKIRFTGGAKAEKVSGKVKTEAMRLARNIVKDELKKAKQKISHYAASDITAAAKALLDENPELMEQAKANLAEREATPVKINLGGLKTDPKKVAAAEKAAAAKKDKAGTVSAKQAGMPAKRKGQPQATAH